MKSLQQKLIVFVVLPVAVILGSIGIAGFFYIRAGLSNRWHQIAVLQMERAAQRLEIRLNNPISLIESFAWAGREPAAEEIQGWLLKELQRQEGAGQVRLIWQGSGKARARVVKASPPIYFYPEHADALGLRSDLLGDAGQPVGRIEVQVKFDSLVQDLLASGWMQTNGACLLDDQGNYLAHVDSGNISRTFPPNKQDPVRLAILKGIKAKPF